MAKRDGAAVDVSAAAIQSEFLFYCEILRRKSLVNFNEIDVVQRQTSFCERATSRRHRPYAHDLRLDTRIRPTHNAAHRSEILLLHKLFAGDHQRRRTIDDAGSIACGDESVVREGGF